MKRYLRDGEGVRKDQPSSSSRCIWSDLEDNKLAELTKLYKGKKWDVVAEGVSAVSGQLKTAKQCRERWHNHLNPDITARIWTCTEEDRLFELHNLCGNKWSDIARMMRGRTDNSIKNYFFCRLRKVARCLKYGVGSLELDRKENKLEHTLYLLDHLFKFYISSDRKENLQKIITSQIKGRKNAGDRYIGNLLQAESITPEKYERFLRELMTVLRPEQVQIALHLFPHFSVYSPCDTDDTFSKLLVQQQQPFQQSPASATKESRSSPPLSPGKDVAHNNCERVVVVPAPNLTLRLPNNFYVAQQKKSSREEDDFVPTFRFAAYSAGSSVRPGLMA